MEATIEFSPAIPCPEPFDVQKRIQELRGYLDPNNPHYERHAYEMAPARSTSMRDTPMR
jgi:hypothetical protein